MSDSPCFRQGTINSAAARLRGKVLAAAEVLRPSSADRGLVNPEASRKRYNLFEAVPAAGFRAIMPQQAAEKLGTE
jgi:hypothetical protein